MSEETNPTAETTEPVTLDAEAREIIRDSIRDSAKVFDSEKDLVADRICIAFDATGFERVGMLVAAREVGAPPPVLPRVEHLFPGYALEAFGMKIPLEAEEFLSLRQSMREMFMRPSVESFAHGMENELRANDHKGGWMNDTVSSLLVRLLQEVGELAEAIDVGCSAEVVAKEAFDVGNFAMMIAEVVKARHRASGTGLAGAEHVLADIERAAREHFEATGIHPSRVHLSPGAYEVLLDAVNGAAGAGNGCLSPPAHATLNVGTTFGKLTAYCDPALPGSSVAIPSPDTFGEPTHEEASAFMSATEVAAPTPIAPVVKLRSCNRHSDCDAAEKRAEENGMPERYGAGTPRVDHCHDDDCEDCFGK